MNDDTTEDHRYADVRKVSKDHDATLALADSLSQRREIRCAIIGTFAFLVSQSDVFPDSLRTINAVTTGVTAIGIATIYGLREVFRMRVTPLAKENPLRLRNILTEIRQKLPEFSKGVDMLRNEYLPDHLRDDLDK